MKRREALLLLAAAPLAAIAQQPARTYRVAMAFGQGQETRRRLIDTVRKQLAGSGFVEGKNLEFAFNTDVCCGEHYARQVARGMLKQAPDAVLVFSATLAQAFQLETASTPVVFAVPGDPVALGLVKDYARPGGNLTGVSARQTELVLKRFELLRQLLPKARRVALMAHYFDPAFRAAEPSIRQAATRFGFELFEVDQMAGYEGPLRAAAEARVPAVMSYLPLVGTGQQLTAEGLFEFARARRMVTMVSDAEDAALGGMLSYGTDPFAMAQTAADQLARILKGAPPANIPVDQMSRFEVVLNLKTVKAIGVTVPPAVMLRVDRVIE